MSHVPERIAHPLIAEVIPAVPFCAVPMQPGVVAACPQNERFKFTNSAGSEHRSIEAPWSVTLVEHQAQRVLGTFLRAPIPTALDTDTTIDLERTPVGLNPFDRHGPLPTHTRLERVAVDSA